MGPGLNQTINKKEKEKRKSSRAGGTGQSCIPKYNTCLICRRTSVQPRSHIKSWAWYLLFNCNLSAGEAELGGSYGWLVSQSCLDLQYQLQIPFWSRFTIQSESSWLSPKPSRHYFIHGHILPAGQCCSKQSPDLRKTTDAFSPQVTYIALSGTMKTSSQQGGSFQVNSSSISLGPATKVCCVLSNGVLLSSYGWP